MQDTTLITKIARAFPVDPRPTRDMILYEGAYRGDEELEEIQEFFADRPWNSIAPGDVFRFRHALSFFSPQTFVYFTPAWMTCSLQDEEVVDTAPENLMGILAEANPDQWTQEEKCVICEWLVHFSGRSLMEIYAQAMTNFGCD